MSFPNLISLVRLLAVPLILWLIVAEHFAVAFWVFVIAALTDALDGFIAKRFRSHTALGAYLDPLADKALLVGVYIALGIHGHVVDWLVILIVFRDVLILGGALLVFTLTTQRHRMRPMMISKINTAVQIVFAAAVLGRLGFGVEAGVLSQALLYLVAATTILSGTGYLIKWGRRVDTMEDVR